MVVGIIQPPSSDSTALALVSGIRVGCPEPIEAFCVGILDGGKLCAVGWMIPLFTGKKARKSKSKLQKSRLDRVRINQIQSGSSSFSDKKGVAR